MECTRSREVPRQMVTEHEREPCQPFPWRGVNIYTWHMEYFISSLFNYYYQMNRIVYLSTAINFCLQPVYPWLISFNFSTGERGKFNCLRIKCLKHYRVEIPFEAFKNEEESEEELQENNCTLCKRVSKRKKDRERGKGRWGKKTGSLWGAGICLVGWQVERMSAPPTHLYVISALKAGGSKWRK